MGCGGCYQARTQLVSSVRTGNWRGMASAMRSAYHINAEKARNLYRATQPPQAQRATPYRRPLERTT